jgi:predicted ATP-grasp superfamily ATP-dependent carboligase
MRRIIVVGTGVVAYGVIAEAAMTGYEVVHVSTRDGDLAARSTHIDEGHLVEVRDDTDERVVDFLLEHAAEWSGALLMPVIDDCVVCISRNFAQLSPHYHCTVMPWDIHEQIISKTRLYQVAHELGVPAPRIHEIRDEADLDRVVGELEYPCLLKPDQTPDFFRRFGTKMFEVQDEAELRARYASVQGTGLAVMVSELIPGDVPNLASYISCLDGEGRPIVEGFTRKVRENVRYGVASVIGTVEPIEEIRESTLTLLRHFGYRGYSAPEWKLDDRDGRYKLMEINTRPVLYNRLFMSTGVRFIDSQYRDFVDGEVVEPATARPDVNWMNNIPEMRALKRHLSPSRIGAFRAPYRHRHVYGLPILHDPKPCLRLISRELAAYRRR